MVWGMFNSMGLIDLTFVSTKMNSADYQNILRYRLVPYIQRFPGVRFTLQQDNASIHAIRCTKTWLKISNVKTLNWSSNTLDLNPVENRWIILFESAKDQFAISKAWSEVDNSVNKNLVNRMPERIFQVINRSGGCTDN
uniref:DDE_3 domain-containing protein n=1 Tax=Heterorhabditis bacteriophora TaxID=37862 RepID=A0A1I7W900_HETBA